MADENAVVGYKFLTRTDLPPLPAMETDGDTLYWVRSDPFADRVEVDVDQLVAGGYCKPIYATPEDIVYTVQRRTASGRWGPEFSTTNEDDARDWYQHFTTNGPNSIWRLVKTTTTVTVLETT